MRQTYLMNGDLMTVGVLLAIDCTGSMEVIHNYLAKGLSSIVTKFQEEGVPVQFSAIGFRDYPANPDTAFEVIDFNESILPLETWLSSIKAFGGGSNYGESSMSAIVNGINSVSWPVVKRKVVALFTDDGPHVPDYNVESWDYARRFISNEDIEQIHIFTISRKIERYDELDGHDYVVIRHTLSENTLEDLEDQELEKSIREFVKVSSSGNFGSSEIIVRDDDQFEINPFDIDDDDHSLAESPITDLSTDEDFFDLE